MATKLLGIWELQKLLAKFARSTTTTTTNNNNALFTEGYSISYKLFLPEAFYNKLHTT